MVEVNRGARAELKYFTEREYLGRWDGWTMICGIKISSALPRMRQQLQPARERGLKEEFSSIPLAIHSKLAAQNVFVKFSSIGPGCKTRRSRLRQQNPSFDNIKRNPVNKRQETKSRLRKIQVHRTKPSTTGTTWGTRAEYMGAKTIWQLIQTHKGNTQVIQKTKTQVNETATADSEHCR